MVEPETGQKVGTRPDKWWIPRDWPLRLTPVRLLVCLAVLIFVGESLVMLLLAEFPPLPRNIEAILDSCILLLLLSPAYYVLFRPLRSYYRKHQRADEEVRYLSRQLLQASEEEKRRLARDLHDACGQSIAALQYKLGAFGSGLPEDADPRQVARFEQLNELVHQLSDQIRNLSARLRPVMLEDFGLTASLKWHVEELARQWDTVDFSYRQDLDREERFAGETEIALFRICQEALNNALRHSGAKRITVTLFRDGQAVCLSVRDNGCGFETAERGGLLRLDGIGLLGMRERADALGGKLVVDSGPGSGTKVTACLPVEGVKP